MNTMLSYIEDESGASAAEYALILAIIGAAIGTAMLALGSAIHNSIINAKNCVATPSTC